MLGTTAAGQAVAQDSRLEVQGSVLEKVERASWWYLGYTSIALEIMASFCDGIVRDSTGLQGV